MKNDRIKTITAAAMLSAMAYAAVCVGRVPVVLFLKYDPKDIIIALGGLLWGPCTVLRVSAAVSLLEMVTISENGVLGCVMNILSTCSFALPAALLFRRDRSRRGLALGLLAGGAAMVLTMLLWNYLVTPVYMGCPREEVAKLLLPAFLPFNLLKAGLNGAGTLLLAVPAEKALSRAGLLPKNDRSKEGGPLS